MKVVLLLLLLNVSQHSLAVVVEVYEGEKSVLLPCSFSHLLRGDDAMVEWTGNNLNPRLVHRHKKKGDASEGQNWHYRGRTSMRPDALGTGDFSLTLERPRLTDSSNYSCTVSEEKYKQKVADVLLRVKDHQVEVKVEEGSESIILPCKTEPGLPENSIVEWTRSGQELMVVHAYSNSSNYLEKQHCIYCERTKMSKDLLGTGDLSLTLKYPTDRDTGGYICNIYRDKDILRQKVVLHQVKESFPSWAKAVLVVLVLVLVLLGVLLFLLRDYFKSVYQVEVESGVKSVLLPCKVIRRLPKDAKVEWKNGYRAVCVYQKDCKQSEEQHQDYRDQAKMRRNLLRTGDLSLTLKHPTDGDRGTFTCTVYSREGNILMKKKVILIVKVPQVEVESGVESVLLPFKHTVDLPEDAKVEWTDNSMSKRKVHVYQNDSDQPEEQDQDYRDRTEMNEDPLRTGDLSLTLKHPTERDTIIYTCTIYSREGNILMKRDVELKVKVPQVEAESGVESVRLPCNATISLPEDAKVVWESAYGMVHVYQNGPEQPGEQDKRYRDRTEMNEVLLRPENLSLTLKHPTDGDSGTYSCIISDTEKKILMKKEVKLKVKVSKVEAKEGAQSVRLTFRTTGNLPEGTKVEWWRKEPKPLMNVCAYQKDSDQSDRQHQVYRGRTEMTENPLHSGDLSLTLKRPTEADSGEYSCKVSIKERDIWMTYRYTTVMLKINKAGSVQVQDQDNIRNGCNAAEPLMAEQSV